VGVQAVRATVFKSHSIDAGAISPDPDPDPEDVFTRPISLARS
jgi:hypothetical protein